MKGKEELRIFRATMNVEIRGVKVQRVDEESACGLFISFYPVNHIGVLILLKCYHYA